MVDVDVDEPVPDVCVTVGEGDPVSVSSMAKVTASDWRTAPCRSRPGLRSYPAATRPAWPPAAVGSGPR